MVLRGSDIVLASQSPRRRELLQKLGFRDFAVCPADVDETVPPGITPQALVRDLSRRKALALNAPGKVVIAADTVVALEGDILGKPRDEAEARSMLRRLSGREHQVYTGVTVALDGRAETGVEETLVRFRPLSDREIEAYLATGEPMDKAGAYGIQERGCLLVQGIRGDFFNVMGLPLGKLADLLESFNIFLRAQNTR